MNRESGDSETANRCVTHRPPKDGDAPRQAEEGYKACARCGDRMHEWLHPGSTDDDGNLTSIPDLYDQLDPTFAVGGSERRAPGFGSRPPGSVHVMAMRDRRNKPMWRGDGHVYVWDPKAKDEDGKEVGAYTGNVDAWEGADGKLYPEHSAGVSVVAALFSWCYLLAEERGLSKLPAQNIADVCEYLDRNLDWVCRQDWVDELHRDLGRIRSTLRTQTGDPKPQQIGKCFRQQEDGTECGAAIYEPTPVPGAGEVKTVLRCSGCGSPYSNHELILLALSSKETA